MPTAIDPRMLAAILCRRQDLKMANDKAYNDELSSGLPFVLIQGTRNEQGHLRHDIVRQVGGRWENWDQHAQSWRK